MAVGLVKILVWPFLIRLISWAFAYAYFANTNVPGVGWRDFMFAMILPTRFGAEFAVSGSCLQQLEFDEWFADLYEQRVQVRSYEFYIHPRPWIVYCLLALGPISWIALVARERVERSPVWVLFVAAFATETSQLPVT